MVSVVGTDEVDLDRHHISWVSPLERALLASSTSARIRQAIASATAVIAPAKRYTPLQGQPGAGEMLADET